MLTAQPMIYAVVKSIGAIYLAWIGFKMLRGAIWRRHDESKKVFANSPRASLTTAFRQGLLTNVLNPKIALFFLAAIPQFVGETANAPIVSVLLILINGAINLTWLTVVATGIGKVGTRLASSQALRFFEGVVGAALVGMAGRIAFNRN